MWQTLKKYNWEKFASDIIVVMLSAGLTFLVNWLSTLNLGEVAVPASGAVAFTLNRAKELFKC